MKTLKGFDFSGKTVLVRTDYNVKASNGRIIDDTRIRKSLDTLKYILEQKPKQLVIMSHFGRPEGKAAAEFRMDAVAERLSKLLGMKVKKLDSAVDADRPADSILMLENLRFYPGEEADDEEFAKKLAGSSQVYVNDAFGVCHRKHASVHAIARLVPGCMGLLVEKEIEMLSLKNPERPVAAIIGGAKLSTKLKIIKSLLPKVDKLLIGGAMMFTFYKAQGMETGTSLVEPEFISEALEIMKSPKVVLPTDVMVGPWLDLKATGMAYSAKNMPSGGIGLDIGPESIMLFKEQLKDAKTVIWNGPLGYYENPNFAAGTNEIAKCLAELDAKTIVGGGDSIDAVNKLGLAGRFTHISTGGGASLSLMAGEQLPAFQALDENEKRFS